MTNNDWFNKPTEKMISDAKKAMARFEQSMNVWRLYGSPAIANYDLFEKSSRYAYSLLERMEKAFGHFQAFQEAVRDLSLFGTGGVPREFQIEGMSYSAMLDNFHGQCYGAYVWLECQNVRPSLAD